MVFGGLLLVVLDFRIDWFDVLPDVIGWLMVIAGLSLVRGRHPGLLGAFIASCLGLVSSVVQLLPDGELTPLVAVGESVAQTGVVFGVCTALMTLGPEPRIRSQAGLVRWLDLGLALIGVVLAPLLTGAPTLSFAATTGAAVGVFLLLVVAAIVVFVWFMLLLWASREAADLQRSTGAG